MKTSIKSLVIGPSGSGKSYFSGGFPKSYIICTEPDGLTTLEMNPQLIKNVVKHQYFIPSPVKEVKQVFVDLQAACKEAHELYAKGEIETLVLDNMSYLSENRWMYINKYEPEMAKSGELDTRGMYGKLGRWLYEFTLMNLCSFPGNVVVTSHIKMESDEAMKKKAGDDDVVADILGGFRNQAPGMFSLVMFLDKIRVGDNKYKYMGRINLGNGKLAKNRYNLPEVLENISYQTILNAIIKSKEQITK